MQKTKKYPINPSDEIGRRKKKMGQVVVIEDRCKGCGFCIANCPRQVLRVSSVFNKKGYHPPEVIDTTRCVNCHFCEILCPEFAIYSVEYDDLEEQD
ncbi:MAG: 4Fe-4S binding protein [Smithellaceae bacterium]|nr:4Fe-4S binding protein [Syntrophaceae bacterium]MDD4240667.1 4Fe-4S binding protein [Smithellaceae bacterium]NLX52826.1 4Fe-4S binding protein [Deltaproteobacteria bacterium]